MTVNKKARAFYGPSFFILLKTDYIGFLVVSVLVVSGALVVSVAAGAVVAAVESVLVLSEPLVAFSEPQPVTIEPMIIAAAANAKKCFFIDISLKCLLFVFCNSLINLSTPFLFI